ncbi:MAG: triphosphoribosyl-dephospho-CoA synthase [Prolixibacteraceae bacterium]|jgi:holo-ACP synthase/triphosphoribosyl-dephospho-CoA synthase|nr:triphosphoribosyl-dephospho-CoA synthase [Prolixibacteraceae bacterium]
MWKVESGELRIKPVKRRRNKIEPLQSILNAREQRALLKNKIAGRGYPCVSLSLNVPGFPKSNPTVNYFFKYCLQDLQFMLKAHLVEVHDKEAIEKCDAAGDFYVAPFTAGSMTITEIKQMCENFEEGHPLGRYIDVDVNDESGNCISSGKSKMCFYCQVRPAIECRREQAHDMIQMRSLMFSNMKDYCNRQRESLLSKHLASLGLKALLYEISLTPKPGLVDRLSNGSHEDMNFLTFADSSSAISLYFEELVQAGFAFHDEDYTRALPIVRNIGLRMEAAMFQATGNINTHKGLIFLMGVALFSCGKLYSSLNEFDTEYFRSIVRDICRDIVKRELMDSKPSNSTHGLDVFQSSGFSGARGEAEGGFKTVFEIGLPHLAEENQLNDTALIQCFLAIAAQNMDTNILFRGGQEVLTSFQDLCKAALKDLSDSNYLKVAEFCRNEYISPGGSADLLALAIFFWSVMKCESPFYFSPLIKRYDI